MYIHIFQYIQINLCNSKKYRIFATDMRKGLLIVLLLTGTFTVSAEPLRIVSYNVENLFYPTHDSLKNDIEWTPEGERRWSFTRYYNKIENIARVLTNIGEWNGVDIIGLQEIENALCVKRLCYTLRRNEYDFVHYESPDARGIDVALIYKKNRVDTICTKTLQVHLGTQTTRDILYVSALADKKDTLHLFVCHLPSQRGGTAETEWKRQAAKSVLQQAIDSVLTLNNQAKIIVMGDMNSAPKNDINGLQNRMISIRECTHKHQGQWTCLDQFYTSPAIEGAVRIYNAEWIQETDEKYLGLKPKRTYNGFHYQNGYSDHLPIILTLP